MKRILKRNLIGVTSIFLVTAMLLSSCFGSRKSIAIEEGWELLGEQKVNFVRDKDEVQVRSRNMFTAIRFTVEDREVRIYDLKIFFQNGDKLEPALDDVIPANQTSRMIELAKEGRYIERIEFRYRTTGNVLEGRAKVLVLGQRYNPGY